MFHNDKKDRLSFAKENRKMAKSGQDEIAEMRLKQTARGTTPEERAKIEKAIQYKRRLALLRTIQANAVESDPDNPGEALRRMASD